MGSWCQVCKLITPIIDAMAKKKPEVVFLKVDADELESVSEEMRINYLPTFLFFKEGELVHTMVGATMAVVHKVEELSAPAAAAL